jgi:uncharacterized protein YceH (UPF0502 family)
LETQLTPIEARVIGCLIEKEVTTPDQYPLSLNALTSACNQKSNREPVMDLDEATVRGTLDGLIHRRLVSEKSGFGSRVPKFQQRFCNSEFGTLQFSGQELGIVCVLLLRGAQTPGELRTRSNRLCRFVDVSEVEMVLQHLMDREDGPFVVRLPRQPGRRESRYAHLFSGEPEETDDEPMATASGTPGGTADRLGVLEELVATLQDEIADIKRRLGDVD